MDRKEMFKLKDELHRYSSLQNDKMGELNTILESLFSYTDCFSTVFKNALIKEIEEQLETYRQYATIVNREETVTHKYQELEWSG